MRKNFGPQSWLFPMPVLIIGTYDENDIPNVMTAAWGGIYDTNKVAVCIDPSHKTAANMQQRKYFTVNIGDAANVAECDYVGLVSGNTEPDKLTKVSWHAEKAEFADAPIIKELPMTLECRLLSFDTAAGCAVGEILNISADEAILDENGKITLNKFEPLCFDPVNHLYHKIGSIAGTAFEDGLKFKRDR